MADFLLFLQNHWQLTIIVAAVLITLIIIELIKFKQGTARLTPAQAIQHINRNNAVVVDIRNQDAFKTGHIVGAVCIPLNELTEKSKKIEKFKNRPIVLVCATGLESPKAAAILRKDNDQIYILGGGIRGWREADMPLVKD